MVKVMERSVEAVGKLFNEGKSVSEIARLFGMNPSPMGRWMRSKGIYVAAKNRPEWTDVQLCEAIKTNYTWVGVLRQLRDTSGGGSSRHTVKLYANRLGFSTKHFTGRAPRSEVAYNRPSLSEVLVKDSSYGRSCLKKRLLSEGLLENICNLCGISSWRDKTLVMTIDHINGINNDHRLENLRMLCPNCNSQQPTFAGRNKKSEKVSPIFCVDCNKTIHKYSTRCLSCASKHSRLGKTKIDWPSNEELLKRLETTPYTTLGKELGVSDNAIRKRLKY